MIPMRQELNLSYAVMGRNHITMNNSINDDNLNMRNIRKQLQLVSSLSQTILQYRLEPYEGLNEHLKEIRKKIRYMIQSQLYEEGITQMLVTKESFQIKNKVMKLGSEKKEEKQREMYVQIQISAIEKCSCQIYNQQLWQFGIQVRNGSQLGKNQKHSVQGIIQLIQYILKYLQCSSLLPLNKQQKNRYMVDHKVIITKNPAVLTTIPFENVFTQEIVLARENEGNIKKLTSKYFYNERKIQQNIKQIISSRSLETSGNSKKNSIDSTEASRRLSIFEYYDDELDVTVLSGSDFDDEQGEQILLNIQNFEQQEFQILMQQTANDDEQFIRNNFQLLNEFSSLQNYYF